MCFRPAAVSMDKTCPQCGATCPAADATCSECGAGELPASALPVPNVGAPGAPGAPGVPSAPGSPKAPGAPKAPGSN